MNIELTGHEEPAHMNYMMRHNFKRITGIIKHSRVVRLTVCSLPVVCGMIYTENVDIYH